MSALVLLVFALGLSGATGVPLSGESASSESDPCCDHGDAHDGSPTDDSESQCDFGGAACPCCVTLHMLEAPSSDLLLARLSVQRALPRSPAMPTDPDPEKIIHVPRSI